MLPCFQSRTSDETPRGIQYSRKCVNRARLLCSPDTNSTPTDSWLVPLARVPDSLRASTGRKTGRHLPAGWQFDAATRLGVISSLLKTWRAKRCRCRLLHSRKKSAVLDDLYGQQMRVEAHILGKIRACGAKNKKRAPDKPAPKIIPERGAGREK